MEKMYFKINEKISDIKISNYMKENLGFSSSLITKVKLGGVTLNGKVVTMRALVSEGDEICVSFPEEKSENVIPMDIPIDIIYEDEHILAVNKPRNMPTHPSRGNKLPTLASAVANYLGAPFVFRSVNRLDSGTAGIVIIAKNPYSAAKLGKAMKERKINKLYIAKITGIPEESKGIIDAPIARESEGNIKRVVRADGKRAVTEYKVISTEGENAVCEVRLHTGRTHQIRVHFAYIGHPLIGDFLYGVESSEGYSLTCTEITLPHPLTNEMLTIKTADCR